METPSKSIGLGTFRKLKGCKMPPPCNLGYSQFKMKGTRGTMCCRKDKSAVSARKKKPCKNGKVRCSKNGVCMLRKNLKKCHGSVAVAKAVGVSGFSLVDAKKKLRVTYAVSVNGKLKAPGFIGTLKGVTGRGPIEKIANLRRVLSSCKKMGVKLVKQDGKFKTYRTLVGQCGVKFRSTPAPIALSNVLAKYRARKAASKQQMPEYKPSAQAPKQLMLEWKPSAPAPAPKQLMLEWKPSAPLPDDIDLNALDFGKKVRRSSNPYKKKYSNKHQRWLDMQAQKSSARLESKHKEFMKKMALEAKNSFFGMRFRRA
jgi:hypothetical protein